MSGHPILPGETGVTSWERERRQTDGISSQQSKTGVALKWRNDTVGKCWRERNKMVRNCKQMVETLHLGKTEQVNKALEISGFKSFKTCSVQSIISHYIAFLPLIQGPCVKGQHGGCYRCSRCPPTILQVLVAAICWWEACHIPGE